MISYTDNEDTLIWKKGNIQANIMKEVRNTFKGFNIPDPIYFKVHEWTHGTTYWLPGNYDPVKESRRFLTIAPDVHVCGESYSMRQAWIEGALEHSNQLIKIICTTRT
jgi:hypothetical protein